MSASDRVVVLLPTTTAAATATGLELNLPEPFTSAILYLNVTAASGTTPTLNVRVQEVLTLPAAGDIVMTSPPTGTKIYDDFMAFAQATNASAQVARITGGGNTVNAKSDGALAASTIRNGPIGAIWRVQYTIAGTNPSFTFTVTAKLIP